MRVPLLRQFEESKSFTDREAWLLFRLAAFAEACGWTLLILGLLIKRYLMHGNDAAVLMAGQIHGTIFLLYLVAASILYPSLGWSRRRAIVAIAAGIPPYGSLVFELWAAHMRRRSELRIYSRVLAYQAVTE